MKAYLAVICKCTRYRGRAVRREYWEFVLVHSLILIGSLLVGCLATGSLEAAGLVVSVYFWLLMPPLLTVSVRRLHDTGRTGWRLVVTCVPLVGALVLLAFMAQDGQPTANRYGPNPNTLHLTVPFCYL